ncbi:MAG: hypothetical protein HGA96_03590 [Desulfobulbaceae bacterium]|nr:hypothetical protein [Desulfobulbaceae bacterium]
MSAPDYKLPAAGSFTENLRQLNGYTEGDLAEWLFLPGMRFREYQSWWQPGRLRTSPHEGIDILVYRDANGGKKQLAAATKIPPLLAGIVVLRTMDFLGETAILAHDFYDRDDRQLHTFYAHLQPNNAPASRRTMTADSQIGTIALPTRPAPTCPPHLHLSLAWVDKSHPIQDFRWDKFSTSATFEPGDPFTLLGSTVGALKG